MIATAKICREKYPDHKIVFLGPCIAKKLEASEDYPDLGILVLTFKELDQVFQKFTIGDCHDQPPSEFDLITKETRTYPVDGGLTDTSGIRSLLKPEELRIVSGYKNIPAVLKEFEENPTIRFVDVLFCEHGCINGPGIKSSLSIADRTKRIVEFRKR
jgi:iron only hydrogenase large subunit-like protein